jgi:hypothetical protein
MLWKGIAILSKKEIYLLGCISGGFLSNGDMMTNAITYRHFNVVEENGSVVSTQPVSVDKMPMWADDVSQQTWDWSLGPASQTPYFNGPVPYVLPPKEKSGEPFYPHNHQPAIAWLTNGDLMAIWYSARYEVGTELTVLASRKRVGLDYWDPSSEFFKAPQRNMHGSSIFHDGNGRILHFNGMGRHGEEGWSNLALLLRESFDNAQTWTAACPVSSGTEYNYRHQVISGLFQTTAGLLIQPCDAVPYGQGGTALHISQDDGLNWEDPGQGKPVSAFEQNAVGYGTIAGIHAGVVELKDGRLMALGRGDSINGRMPMSLSDDGGRTWRYSASPFPSIATGQRLVLLRLREGPILLVSFTDADAQAAREPITGMMFTDSNGQEFVGFGMYAAVSYDEGETWPCQKLVTPGHGDYDGGAWTGAFTATPTRAEHAGYLAATQTPDGVIHLISSRLHYQFNLKWIQTPS